jgi:hypothetical protein
MQKCGTLTVSSFFNYKSGDYRCVPQSITWCETYLNGKKQRYQERYPSGQLRVDEPYQDGVMHGVFQMWDKLGNLRVRAQTDHGQLVGRLEYWNIPTHYFAFDVAAIHQHAFSSYKDLQCVYDYEWEDNDYDYWETHADLIEKRFTNFS